LGQLLVALAKLVQLLDDGVPGIKYKISMGL